MSARSELGYIDSQFFLASALVGGQWSDSRPGRFTPEERDPGTNWIEGWVGPRAGMDNMEKRKFLTLPVLELRLLGRSARSQSLYRLSYSGSHIRCIEPYIKKKHYKVFIEANFNHSFTKRLAEYIRIWVSDMFSVGVVYFKDMKRLGCVDSLVVSVDSL
jgi:hypothetical protein